jgi:hypothetical protein
VRVVGRPRSEQAPPTTSWVGLFNSAASSTLNQGSIQQRQIMNRLEEGPFALATASMPGHHSVFVVIAEFLAADNFRPAVDRANRGTCIESRGAATTPARRSQTGIRRFVQIPAISSDKEMRRVFAMRWMLRRAAFRSPRSIPPT